MRLELIDHIKAEKDKRYQVNVLEIFGPGVDPLDSNDHGGHLDIYAAMSQALMHLPKVGAARFRADGDAMTKLIRPQLARPDSYYPGAFVDGESPTFREIPIEIIKE